MKRKQYFTPQCETISLATLDILTGSDTVSDDELVISFSSGDAWEDAF